MPQMVDMSYVTTACMKIHYTCHGMHGLRNMFVFSSFLRAALVIDKHIFRISKSSRETPRLDIHTSNSLCVCKAMCFPGHQTTPRSQSGVCCLQPLGPKWWLPFNTCLPHAPQKWFWQDQHRRWLLPASCDSRIQGSGTNLQLGLYSISRQKGKGTTLSEKVLVNDGTSNRILCGLTTNQQAQAYEGHSCNINRQCRTQNSQLARRPSGHGIKHKRSK